VYVLLSLAAQTFLGLSAETDAILDQVDQVICIVFFVDFGSTCSRRITSSLI